MKDKTGERLFQKFKEFITREKLIFPSERVILAVSGGPDSVAMFFLFLRLKKIQRNEFLIAHFNHSLRASADKEEEFVKSLARRFNLRFVSEKKEVKKYYRGDSLEQVARQLRYDFLLKVSRQFKIKKLALAHHKDDLVETVLLHLIRGSALTGLRGILPIIKYKKAWFIRPMLNMEKTEILDFLRAQNIEYIVDESNLSQDFLRNKLRLNLIPQLLSFNPSLKRTIYNMARVISWDYDFICEKARENFVKICKTHQNNLLSLDIKGLKSLHPSLFNYVLRMSIEKIKGNLKKIELKHIEEIKDLINNRPPGSVVDLPEVKIQKEKDILTFKRFI